MSDITVSQSDFQFSVPVKLILQVRTLLQDYAQTNELFNGQEVTDDLIAKYIVDTIDDWNGTPPVLLHMVSTEDLMAVKKYQAVRRWIIDMAAARVLRVLVIKHAKQDIPFTAGNVNVQPHSVWRNLETIYQAIKAEYDNNKAQFKLSENMNNCYGVSHTELWDGMINDIDGY